MRKAIHFGFSYVGLVYLVMLMLPNIIWTKNQPKDYEKYALNENKVLLTGFTGNAKKRAKSKEKLKSLFEMNDEAADQFMECFSKFNPVSIKNEYYTDLLTWLEDDIHVQHTKVHFIYASKMGEKYLKRYRKYFRDPDIREFNMQHEQWLFGGEKYALPVLKAIDEFMETPV